MRLPQFGWNGNQMRQKGLCVDRDLKEDPGSEWIPAAPTQEVFLCAVK